MMLRRACGFVGLLLAIPRVVDASSAQAAASPGWPFGPDIHDDRPALLAIIERVHTPVSDNLWSRIRGWSNTSNLCRTAWDPGWAGVYCTDDPQTGDPEVGAKYPGRVDAIILSGEEDPESQELAFKFGDPAD
jgi:hypothetical protein